MVNTESAPSEAWPEDLAAFLTAVGTANGVGAIYNMISGMFAAGAGAIAIVPDYIGFGQSYELPKG